MLLITRPELTITAEQHVQLRGLATRYGVHPQDGKITTVGYRFSVEVIKLEVDRQADVSGLSLGG